MENPIKASPSVVVDYRSLFVNRLAYTLQSPRPHPESGRHYYFRPKARGTGEELSLTAATIRRHLEGELTIGLFAINPTKRNDRSGSPLMPIMPERYRICSSCSISSRRTTWRPPWR